MNCPFCLDEVKLGALVCRTCRRDIAVPKPLMEANARLTARVAELETELAAAKAAVPSPPTAAAVPSERPPVDLVHMLVFYVALPILVMIAIHYLLVIRIDAKLIWLRVASIVLPAVFGFRFEMARQARRTVLMPVAAGVAVAAVLGMSWMVHLVDGDPILPKGWVGWRETLEYAVSIALSYVLGALLCSGLRPLHRHRHSVIDRLATAIAVVSGGEAGKPLEARIERTVKLMNLGISAATALGAIYTGLKATMG